MYNRVGSDNMTCYEFVKKFKKKYPLTVAWRLFQNSKVVDMHINPKEEILYAFAGQRNNSPFDFFETCVVAITNERILIGQKRVIFGYRLSSVTPDMYNDMEIVNNIIWGSVLIDTIKEEITISNLSKSSLNEVETHISEYMMKAKQKYARRTLGN